MAPDETTFAYLAGRPYAPKGADWEKALAHWRALPSDADARFDHLTRAADELKNDLSKVPPDRRERVRQELEFLHQNAFRMADNLKLVYQQGKFSAF